jgi:hypothetical protein
VSRSIHQTVKAACREFSKAEIDAPDNPAIAELAKKRAFKAKARKSRKPEASIPSDGVAVSDDSQSAQRALLPGNPASRRADG